MTARVILTLDCDWAPDFALDHVRGLLAARNTHATLFATHPSPALSTWMATPDLETGWHPNLLPGSTQGADVAQVVAYLQATVPGARSMRTHDLFQSTSLLRKFLTHAPSIRRDASLYVPGQVSLSGFDLAFGDGTSLRRYPFAWEDDLHLAAGGSLKGPIAGLPTDGVAILNFHPIHVWLNSPDMGAYGSVRALGPMAAITEAQSAPHRCAGDGIGSLFAWALANLDFSMNLEEFAADEARRQGRVP